MAKETWLLYGNRGDYRRVAAQHNIDPVIAKILLNRGVTQDNEIAMFLHGDIRSLYDPALLHDGMRAAKWIKQAIEKKKKIRIIGDYDQDGVFSTYILYDIIRKLGGNIDYAIPDRVKDGYGLNITLVEQAIADHVDLIITCDNGIAAHEQIQYAKDHGIYVVLTDHHQPSFHMDGETKVNDLPNADVIVDPHLVNDTYPYKDICGATVAWKVMQLLLRLYGREQEAYRYIQYVAFATIGDVMPLLDENRILVKYGLEQLSHTDHPGLQALIHECGLLESGGVLSPYHIGFVLGPCINAAGRLTSAMTAVEMLTTDDHAKACALAKDLAALNAERQEMTAKGEEAAKAILDHEPYIHDKVLVIHLPECNERIMGIVAGRVREWSGKPSIIFSDAEDGRLKGSGRSIPNYNLYNELTKVAHLLDVYGGHAGAAGLTITKDNLEPLRQALNANCQLTDDDMVTSIMIDVAMPVSYAITHSTVVNELSLLEPCGQANPRPIFAQANLMVLGMRVLGQKKNVLKFSFQTPDGYQIPGIMFGQTDLLLTELEECFGEQAVDTTLRGTYSGINLDVLYYPEYNEFRGNVTLQLTIKSFRQAKH